MASTTFLIVGLGNPGREYHENRHNIGFMFVDRLAERLSISFNHLRSRALVGSTFYCGKEIILAKPVSFMNLSGKVVSELIRYYELPLTNLLLAHDDIDLTFGTIRLRRSGSSAGHKGIASIFEELGVQEFARLRLGIGRPLGRMDPADYVLQDFSPNEQIALTNLLERAVEAGLTLISEGIDVAMDKFNGKALG